MYYYNDLRTENIWYRNNSGIIVEEQWDVLNMFSNRYIVSNLGRIKNIKTNRILKSCLFKSGGNPNAPYYVRISIKYNSKTFNCFLHRLVLLTFKPISNSEKMDAHHENWQTLDNRLENLSWETPVQNQYKKKVPVKDCAKRLFKELLKTLGNNELYSKLIDVKSNLK